MNLTDKETIKALGCCINKYNSCESCPLLEYGDSKACQDKLQIDTLDLINRQKAEIERLQKIKENSLEIISMGEKQMLEIRKNSIKEFAERLRNEIINKPSEFTADKGTVDFLNGLAHRQNEILDNIDNLVKEMAGENVEENSSF